jgi:hypothetical protein
LNRTFLLYFLALTIQLSGQCFKKNSTFAAGEDLKFDVTYNWGFIWIDAGVAEFKVNPATYINRDVYHLDATGSSLKTYDWLYKVHDHYQSYLDMQTLLPLWHHRENFEGGYVVDDQYIFNWRDNKVFAYTKNSNQDLQKDTIKLTNRCTFDLLSLIYYSRNLYFDGLKINDTIPIYTIIGYEKYNLFIRYLGRETITLHDGTSYKCIKFSAMLVEGTMFKGGEDLIVWVSDDQNRVPVLVEAKILVGSVKANLQKATGLKYPFDAKIKTAEQ